MTPTDASGPPLMWTAHSNCALDPGRHRPPPSPPKYLPRRFLSPPPRQTIRTHCQTTTPPPPTPVMRIRPQRILMATAHPPHISAWSVTCKSIAQRLVNQCLEQPHTLAASVKTVPTSPEIRPAHRPIQPYIHSRKTAVDNHRLYHTITPSLTSTCTINNTTRRYHIKQALH
ncbi:hypothetical protein SprV_0200628900 [Sparganum proliferum]